MYDTKKKKKTTKKCCFIDFFSFPFNLSAKFTDVCPMVNTTMLCIYIYIYEERIDTYTNDVYAHTAYLVIVKNKKVNVDSRQIKNAAVQFISFVWVNFWISL